MTRDDWEILPEHFDHDEYLAVAELKRCKKAIGKLLVDHPFYATALMEQTISPSFDIPTAGTNGAFTVFNPHFTKQLSMLHLQALFAHEAIHPLHLHPYRRQEREKLLWNAAADFIVNHTLAKDGFQIPMPACLDSQRYDHRWTPERVYADLKRRIQEGDKALEDFLGLPPQGTESNEKTKAPQGSTSANGSQPAQDNSNDNNTDSQQDAADNQDQETKQPTTPEPELPDQRQQPPQISKSQKPIEDEPEKQLTEDKTEAHGKEAGDETGNSITETLAAWNWGDCTQLLDHLSDAELRAAENRMLELTAQATLIDAALKGADQGTARRVLKANKSRPTQSWQHALGTFIQANTTKDDYSWRRPNKRWMASGIYMPSLQSTQKAELFVVAFDTSGSISRPQLKRFLAYLDELVTNINSSRWILIQCDTQVKHVTEITPEDVPIQMKIVGRGGTAFGPVFRHVKNEKLQPNALIYFTDLMGHCDETDPGYPVRWLNFGTWEAADTWRGASFGEVIDMDDEYMERRH
jgi:predicted metal-dependent peptidase